MEELSRKGIQNLRSSINEMFKSFDVKPNNNDLDKVEQSLDLSKLKDQNPIDEDMDLKLPDLDLSGLDDLDSLLPSGNLFDSLFKNDSVKL
nr:MAG TPA: hypothetical protein [Caudoviricetes sp.]